MNIFRFMKSMRCICVRFLFWECYELPILLGSLAAFIFCWQNKNGATHFPPRSIDLMCLPLSSSRCVCCAFPFFFLNSFNAFPIQMCFRNTVTGVLESRTSISHRSRSIHFETASPERERMAFAYIHTMQTKRNEKNCFIANRSRFARFSSVPFHSVVYYRQ